MTSLAPFFFSPMVFHGFLRRRSRTAFFSFSLKRKVVCPLLLITLTTQLLVGCAHPTAAGPVHWDLSPEAELTYGNLLLDQSIRNEDKAGVLEAMDILLRLDERPQPFVDAAAWLMMNKELAESRTLLEKAVQRFPNELGLHLLLAETWLEEGKTDQAVNVLRTYQTKNPKSELIKQELGILFVKANRYKEADRIFSALPARLRTSYVRFCHAQALLGLQHPNRAITELRLAVQENPDFLEAWSELARILEQQQHVTEATVIYTNLLEQDPGNQELWLRLVALYLRAGKPAQALETVLAGPESFGFQLTAVTLFLDGKEFRQAEALLAHIQNEPDAPDEVNFYLAAVAYEYHKDIRKTLDLLASIPAENRLYDRSLRLRAQLLYDLTQYEDALNVIRLGKELLPEDREFRLMETHVLLTLDRFSEALASADEALEQWPGDEEVMFLRGNILDALGRKSEAFIVMENIIDKNPDAYQALNYIGYSLAEQNRDLDRALALLNRAASLQPGKAYVLDSLAWAQYRKGLLEEAWGNIRAAVRLPDGEDAAIWEHYGDIAAAVGNNAEARRGWKKALTLSPANPEVLQNKLNKL